MPNFLIIQPAVDLIEVALEDNLHNYGEALDDLAFDLGYYWSGSSWALSTRLDTCVEVLTWTVAGRDVNALTDLLEADELPYKLLPA